MSTGKRLNKGLSLLLALVMIFSLLPISALAVEEESAALPSFSKDLDGASASYVVGDGAVQLEVSAESADGGTVSYQWYSNAENSTAGGTEIADAVGTSYTPSIENAGKTYYFVKATNTIEGKEAASAFSSIAEIVVSEAAPIQPLTDGDDTAETPVFGTNLSTDIVSYTKGEEADALTVSVNDVSHGGSITYQWYSNTVSSTENAARIDGAVSASYTPSTETTGTTHYYAVVTNTVAEKTPSTAISNIAAVTVTEGEAVAYNGQTIDGNYTISTATQLAQLATTVNAGMSYADSTFTLLNDIDLSTVCGPDINGIAVSWTPIGNNAMPFNGAFDGGEFTIKNIYIYIPGSSGNISYQALFGYVSGSAISNLTVSGSLTFDIISLYCAGIAGYGFNSEFVNCTNHVNIKTTRTAGNANYYGGIVGYGSGLTISQCENYGDIHGRNNIGGIFGGTANSAVTQTLIENSKNYGNITSYGSALAGIVGNTQNHKVTVSTCFNYGNLSGVQNIGGIIGTAFDAIINGCVNENDAKITATTTAGSCAGGIVGSSTNTSLSNCVNHGSVTVDIGAVTTGTGGIVGNFVLQGTFIGTVSGLVNTGTVTTQINGGGLIGQIQATASSNLSLSNSYNIGEVIGKYEGHTTPGGIGGLFGFVKSSSTAQVSIENCYTAGNIDAENLPMVGGLAGKILTDATTSGITFKNCYNAGSVSGKVQVGGVVGLITATNANLVGNITINNCYSAAPLVEYSAVFDDSEPITVAVGIGELSVITSAKKPSLSNVFAREYGELLAIGKDSSALDSSAIVGLSGAQMAEDGFVTLLGGAYAKLSPNLYLKDDGTKDFDENKFEEYQEIYGDYAYPILLVLSGKEATSTYNVKFVGAGYTSVIANGFPSYATTVMPGGSVQFTVESNYPEVTLTSVSMGGTPLTADDNKLYDTGVINSDTTVTVLTDGTPPVEDKTKAYPIVFNVKDSEGSPISDAQITVTGQTAGEGGSYSLKTGTYEATITKDGYHSLTGSFAVTSKKTEFNITLSSSSTTENAVVLRTGYQNWYVDIYNGDLLIATTKNTSGNRLNYYVTALTLPTGAYTYTAMGTGAESYSGISIGSGPLNVDGDQTVTLRFVDFAKQLKNLNNIGYKMTVTTADGKAYLPGSEAIGGGSARGYFVLPTETDGIEYNYAFVPALGSYWGSHGTTYLYDSSALKNFGGMNTSDSGMFVISPKTTLSLTVPSAANLKLYYTVKFYEPSEPIEHVSVQDNSDGTNTYYYNVPSRTDLQFELKLKGYIKYADRFSIPAIGAVTKTISLSALTADTGKDFIDSNGYDSDIVMNMPDSKYIELNTGEKFELYCFRNWQAIDSGTANHYVDPDYKIEVIYGNSVEVTDPYYAGATINAVDGKSGVSLVRVTYGALDYLDAGVRHIYSKLWEQNTAVLIFNVNPTGSASIDTGINQGEFETAYYARSINGLELDKEKQYAEYTFTPKITNGTLSKVEIHAPIGSQGAWDDSAWTALVPNADSSYTAKLVDGRSIVRVTAADGTAVYRSVRAYGVAVKITGENVSVALENNMFNISADVSDTVKISYDGIQMPFPKLGAIYNPGYPDKTYVGYTLSGVDTNTSRSVESEHTQYGVSTINTLTLTFDSPDTYTLTKGGINTTAFGEANGGHRAISKGGMTGKQSTYTGGNSAETEYGLFSTMPNITLNITGVEDTGTAYETVFKVPADSGRLLVRNSLGYLRSVASTEGATYTYSLYNNSGTETYTYYLERSGYVTQIGTFDIENSNVNIDLTSGVTWKPIIQSGTATVSVVGYETILADAQNVSISSAPDDLFSEYYVKYNHGGYTVLHALLDALEVNKASFTCKNGALKPAITLSDTVGADAGWICEVNGTVVTDYANTLINGTDSVVFYYNPATADSMRHAWFEEASVTSKRDGTASFTLMSTPIANDGSQATAVSGATIYIDGKVAGLTGSDGKITMTDLTSLAIGQHAVTAQLNKTLTFARAVLTIEKTDAGSTTPEGKVTVTFRMIGDTVHAPAYKGYINWIQTETHVMDKGTTMETLFKQILDDHDMTYDETADNYVAWISAPPILKGFKLAEFDNGKNSGWMYTVDGDHPNLGLCEYVLKDGDEIIWHYVNDYTLESTYEGSVPKYLNSWLVAADVKPYAGMVDESKDNADNSKITEPKNDDEEIVLTPKVTAKDGVASVTVSASDMSTAIANAKKNGSNAIVIEPEVSGKTTKATVELPKASLSSMSTDTSASLKVITPTGTVTIPNNALTSIASQASGTSVTVSVEAVETKSLTAEQQKLAGENKVYDVSIFSGDKAISSFDGKNITISLPYTLKDGETANGVTVWYLNDAGKLQRMSGKYDAATKLVTFATTHLSKFVVGYEKPWNNPFADVNTSDWFYDAVRYAVQNELFTGTSDTAFSPNAEMTRAMLVTVLYRLEGKPAVTASNTFNDVKADQWYTDGVLWANDNKLVEGYGNGTFGTNDSITREQLAAILYRYAQLKGYDGTKTIALTKYTDAASVSDWANTALKWANAEGLITGTTDTTLSPAGTASRAQVATILMRYDENIVK